MSFIGLILSTGTSTVLYRIGRLWLGGLAANVDKAELVGLESRIANYSSTMNFVKVAATATFVASAIFLTEDLWGGFWSLVVGATGGGIVVLTLDIVTRMTSVNSPSSFLRSVTFPLALVRSCTRYFLDSIPLSDAAVLASPNSRSDEGAFEELKAFQELLDTEEDLESLGRDEQKMLAAILDLKDQLVREVMIPRPDVDSVSSDATLEDAAQIIIQSGHSRIPLYEGTMDNVIGVVYARDILKALIMPKREFTLTTLARSPYFVPETKKAQDLLREFLAQSIHFALVVDEHGGVEGVITLEDLLEEIVGEIEQEHELPPSPITKLSPTEAIIEGHVSLDDLNEALAVRLEGQGFETVGGLALHHLGRLAEAGDSVEVDDLLLEVLSTSGRRASRLRVRKLPT